MKNTTSYKTKQRTALWQAVTESGGAHITVDGLTSKLEAQGSAVGRTTVYRYLEKLTREGKLRKYVHTGESSCYQYVGEAELCHEHFHLKCENCGRLIHMECGHIDEFGIHIENEHGFKINKLKTVLYGICRECETK